LIQIAEGDPDSGRGQERLHDRQPLTAVAAVVALRAVDEERAQQSSVTALTAEAGTASRLLVAAVVGLVVR